MTFRKIEDSGNQSKISQESQEFKHQRHHENSFYQFEQLTLDGSGHQHLTYSVNPIVVSQN